MLGRASDPASEEHNIPALKFAPTIGPCVSPHQDKVVTIETKSSTEERAQCQTVGKNIKDFETRQTDLRHHIHSAEQKVYAARLRSAEIEQEVRQIEMAQQTARVLPSRGGPPGVLIGEITAQVIRLATQKDALERKLERLRSEMSRLEGSLADAQRRLENVEYNLRQSYAAFDRLGCKLSDRQY